MKPKQSLLTSLVNLLLFPCGCDSSQSDQVRRNQTVPTDDKIPEDSQSVPVQVSSVCHHGEGSVGRRGEGSLGHHGEGSLGHHGECSLGRHGEGSVRVTDLEELSAAEAHCEEEISSYLPPLRPLLRSNTIANMQEALKKAEAEDNAGVPSGFFKSSSKKQHNTEKAKLAKLETKQERQEMKTQLAQRKKSVKVELKKVKHSKRRALLEEALQARWSKVDERTEDEVAKAKIQQNNTMIETLEREVELLKEKQECKVTEHDLLCKKGHKGIISEAVRQCKVLKIKHKHSTLKRKISAIQSTVSTLKDEVSATANISLNTNDAPVVESFKADLRDISSKQLAEKECLLKFQERCEKQASKHATDCEEGKSQIPKDNESTYSSDFEDDVDEENECSKSDQEDQPSSPRYPLYRCMRLVPLHKLLPRPLEIIDEETSEDLMDYEKGMYLCNIKFYQSCNEPKISDCSFEDCYYV